MGDKPAVMFQLDTGVDRTYIKASIDCVYVGAAAKTNPDSIARVMRQLEGLVRQAYDALTSEEFGDQPEVPH